ncbi:MAG TPA: hypothetical protein VFZ02_14110, partial [Ktedonobacteraceae bacterium]
MEKVNISKLKEANVKDNTDARLHQQDKVNAYFQAQSSYWKEVYVSEGVQAEIYRDRQATVLAWI